MSIPKILRLPKSKKTISSTSPIVGDLPSKLLANGVCASSNNGHDVRYRGGFIPFDVLEDEDLFVIHFGLTRRFGKRPRGSAGQHLRSIQAELRRRGTFTTMLKREAI